MQERRSNLSLLGNDSAVGSRRGAIPHEEELAHRGLVPGLEEQVCKEHLALGYQLSFPKSDFGAC